MRFLFVDKISECSDERIIGERQFVVAEPMQYLEPGFSPIIAPGVICEAMGQLASWLCLKRKDFTIRPVFLFAERIRNFRDVRPGERLELEAIIEDFADNSCRFSAEARVNGETVQVLEHCAMSFVPLQELEEPGVSYERFQALSSGGIEYPGAEAPAFAFRSLIDEVLDLQAGQEILVQKTFAADEPFYPDHFPRFPVTPVVILNEMIAQASRVMLGFESMGNFRVRSIEACKIRLFIKPSETCTTKVKRVSEEWIDGRLFVTADAEICKEKRRILRARWQFEIIGAV